jgi:hypothetical protein
VTTATAAAAVKTSSSSEQHREQQQQQQQQQQQHGAAQSECETCSRVWLPHKQLWVPDGDDTSPAPSNSTGNGATSSTAQLQRVFMAAAAVSCLWLAVQGRALTAESNFIEQ